MNNFPQKRWLEKEIEIEPPGIEPVATELTVEPDPLETILQEQQGYTQRFAPQILEIWEREKLSKPKLKAATCEEYQIRLSEEGQPELYRRDRHFHLCRVD